MFGISFSELLVVLIVAILLMKPEDLPIIAQKVKEFRKIFLHFKQEFHKNIDIFTNETQELTLSQEEDIEEINFYIKKIIELGGSYSGNYNLSDIKDYYKSLNQEKLSQVIQDKKV